MAHSMVWLETDEIIQKVPCTCIDGRTPGMRYSVAGGSFGLLVHALAGIQRRLGRNLQPEHIDTYLRLFAEKVGPLYLHTDQHGLDCIYARLGLPSSTKLSELTPAQQRTFAELAAAPECQGCGHLALMMTEADYEVPGQTHPARHYRLSAALLRGHRENLIFDVLNGRHEEESVVLLNAVATDDGRQPLYLDAAGQTHRFFCHRPLKQALVAHLRSALEQADLPSLDEDDWERLLADHNEAAEKTLSRLAPQLPVDHLELTTEEKA